MISSARRNEYLEAMGIDVWVPVQPFGDANDAPATENAIPAARARRESGQGIVIGPGTGNLMLLCADSKEASTPLAADIARCLDCEPVWSWPSSADSDDGMPLEQAIADRLFTRVLVFGSELQLWAINPATPAPVSVLGSARLLQVASLTELAQKATARRALWAELSANNWCGPRSR